MFDECPRLIIVAGYLSIFIVCFAGIWYLFLWLFTCEPCRENPFDFIQLLLGFSLIFVFAGYMLVKMLFPVRTGPLLFPH